MSGQAWDKDGKITKTLDISDQSMVYYWWVDILIKWFDRIEMMGLRWWNNINLVFMVHFIIKSINIGTTNDIIQQGSKGIGCKFR